MKNIFLLFIYLFFFYSVKAQIEGQLIDEQTKNPIPFASVVPKNSFKHAVVSNIDGFYSISIPKNIDSVIIKHVSYKTITVNKSYLINNTVIKLKPSVFKIEEVAVKAKENPAHRIVRKTIKNKKLHNPDKYNYICDIYQKTTLDFTFKDSAIIDSSNMELKNFSDSLFGFLMETHAVKYYKKNKGSKEIVKAVRVAGFKRPEMFFSNTNIQPFHFYNEYINLYGQLFLSPISKQSIGKYYYQIVDTLIHDNDTVFSIFFRPYKNKVFSGLKGQMRITTNGYALKDIYAKPAGHHLLQVNVNQQYSVFNKRWFPSDINYDLYINNPQYPNTLIKMSGRSQMTNPVFDTIRRDVKINDIVFLFDKKAFARDTNYWNNYRIKKLSAKEQNTYTTIDSLSKKIPIEPIMNWYFLLLETGKLPIKFISFDIKQIYNYNLHEGMQLGLGIYTNSQLIKWLELGGYYRYGFKDKRAKYGADLTFIIKKIRKFKLGVGYRNDVDEPGFNNFDQQAMSLFSRRLILNRADSAVQYFAFAQRQFGKWFFRLDARKTYIKPLYNYTFENNKPLQTFDNRKISLSVSYAPKEQSNYFFGHLFSVPNFPVFKLKYTFGLINKTYSQNYHKVLLSAIHKFKITGLGKSTVHLKAGYIHNPVPLFALIEGEGSFEKNVPFIFNGYFQTMKPSEFFNNQFSALFYSHNFGSVFKISEKIKPELIISQNVGWGKLNKPQIHKQIELNDMQKGYFESGITLNNLLLANIYNFAYIGFGFGTFYRYGAYSYSKDINNFAFKMSISAKY